MRRGCCALARRQTTPYGSATEMSRERGSAECEFLERSGSAKHGASRGLCTDGECRCHAARLLRAGAQAIVGQNGGNLGLVPKKEASMPTEEEITTTVGQNGGILGLVPKKEASMPTQEEIIRILLK